MKPAKPFVVEIKRKGRRIAPSDQSSIWHPKMLKSATATIKHEQDEEATTKPAELDVIVE